MVTRGETNTESLKRLGGEKEEKDEVIDIGVSVQ